MDFTFTEDQLLFRDTIRRFLMNEATPELLREVWETETGRSERMYQQFAEQGLTALSIPEAFGGLGCGDVDWVLLAQDLGYYAVPDSLISSACIAVGILNSLPEASPLRAEWLPQILDGSARVAVGHPVNSLVADAHVANVFLLHHEGALHAVSASAVKLTANPSVDPARRLFRVEWSPGPGTRILDAEQAQAVWADTLERGALATSAQLLGLAQRIRDLSVDYSVERKQFGKPIGSFQAVKHLVANMAVQIEFAKPVVYRAAHALAHRHPLRHIYVSHAKLAAGEAAWFAAKNGIQVHGAMGYTWEMDLQIFMKRAWALDAEWGDRGFHKARLADFVLDEDAALGPEHTFNSTTEEIHG